MIRNLIIATCAALFASIVSAQAATVTFDEEGWPVSLQNYTYSEAGFGFTGDDDTSFIIRPIGEEGSGLTTSGAGSLDPDIEDAVVITNASGNLFSLDSLRFKSEQGVQSDTVSIVGYLAGEIIAEYTNLSSTSASGFSSLFDPLGVVVDEIRIVITGAGETGLMMDNFVFSEVPLPAAVWMFLAGIFGFGFARRQPPAD